MKKAILSTFVMLSFGAQALTLEAGESTKINGTFVRCEGGVAAHQSCQIRPDDSCYSTAVKIYVDGRPVGACMYLKEASEQMTALKLAGICG